MKTFALWALLCLAIGGLAAYQNHAIGLYTPSALEESQGEFNIGHRFYGAVNEDPIETFFGMNNGTNANVSYRHHLPLDLEAKLGYTSSLNQYEIGVAWLLPFQILSIQTQADVSLSWLDRPGTNDRTTDIGVYVSAQNEPLFKRLAFTVNAGYNTLYERIALGLGVNLKLLEKVSLLGEYYPLLDTAQGSQEAQTLVGSHSAFSFGIKIDTYNHNFIFSLGNADNFNPGRLALGSYNRNDLHFGFNIKRRLNF